MNKKCTKCLIEKPYSDFDKSKNKISSECKMCRRLRQNQQHKLFPQKYKYRYEKDGYLRTKRNREKWSKLYNVSISAIAHHGLKIARMVFDKYNRKCNECGSQEHLAIHHRDGKGSNYSKKHLKPNNELSNLELLCIRCHGSIHGKVGGKLSGIARRKARLVNIC